MGGDNSPWGYNTEIYYDFQANKDTPKNATDLDNKRFLEICNIVFPEFYHKGEENLPLKEKCVDVGGGLERIAMKTTTRKAKNRPYGKATLNVRIDNIMGKDNENDLTIFRQMIMIHEVMENKEGGYKLFKSLENSKKDLEPDSPEYQEQLQNVFSIVSEAHASGKAFEVDNGRFDGDAEAGKATFQAIANSLSAADKENFHF
ncbi:1346_t:CDS:2 [Entrophospora sp. SA101]|nr:6939_t:CDS:2 [Entrophospora sp. SA101]CAJ0748134.1 1346_t:CDS:2 [Entrophospora sp. SA101]CAJ0875032.1 6844_t:CDS:2 [Entrophospora sp. SA101]